MTKIVKMDNKRKDIKGNILNACKEISLDVDSAIIAYKTRKGEVYTAFINTNFTDDAVLSKIIELDIFKKQMRLEVEDDD